ncbi:MAG: hypothetical protein M5U09_16650 [Gammaproteobacteria bacterium]|nr:hypothetical protein [Gammaproteobacteria bacterium]
MPDPVIPLRSLDQSMGPVVEDRVEGEAANPRLVVDQPDDFEIVPVRHRFDDQHHAVGPGTRNRPPGEAARIAPSERGAG